MVSALKQKPVEIGNYDAFLVERVTEREPWSG